MLLRRKIDFFIRFLSFSIISLNLLYNLDSFCSVEIFVMFEWGGCFFVWGVVYVFPSCWLGCFVHDLCDCGGMIMWI